MKASSTGSHSSITSPAVRPNAICFIRRSRGNSSLETRKPEKANTII